MLVEVCKTPWGCPGCTIEVTARAKESSDTQTAFSCRYGSAGKGCEGLAEGYRALMDSEVGEGP